MGRNKKKREHDKKRKRENESDGGDTSSDQSRLGMSMSTPQPATPGQPGNMSASPTNYQAAMSQLSQQMMTQHHIPIPSLPSSPIPTLADLQQQQLIQMMTDMARKVDACLSKMSKLDGIDHTVRNIQVKVIDIEKEVATIRRNVSDLEKSTAMAHDIIEKVQKRSEETDGKVNVIREQVDEIDNAQNEMKETILDLQCRSMRDNLMFFGLAESVGPERENCETKVLDFIEHALGVEDANERIKFDRAHRLGRRTAGKNRPIVAKFSVYKEREEVRGLGHKLKGTRFGISEQFPREVSERRKELLPKYREALQRQQKASLVADKLYIDGKQWFPVGRR